MFFAGLYVGCFVMDFFARRQSVSVTDALAHMLVAHSALFVADIVVSASGY
jgi:hypothetical protein